MTTTTEAKGINFLAFLKQGGDLDAAVQDYDYINCRIMGGAFRVGGLEQQMLLKEGQELTLELDRDNPADAFAIAIYDGKKQLGYVPKELASHIRRATDYVCKVVAPYVPEEGNMNNWGAKIRLIKRSFIEACTQSA